MMNTTQAEKVTFKILSPTFLVDLQQQRDQTHLESILTTAVAHCMGEN